MVIREQEQPPNQGTWRKLFPLTPSDEPSSAAASVTEALHEEWAAAAERERQRKGDQQAFQESKFKPPVSAKVIKAVQREDNEAGQFEIVMDHTGALGVVSIRVVKGSDPADLGTAT